VFGDQDRRDLPIRAALYGGRDAEEFEEWFKGDDGIRDEDADAPPSD